MADEAAPSQNPNRFTTVTLATAITRGTTEITCLDLRKPRAGELRGLNMQDVLTSEVSAVLKLIPRISSPPLTQDEADALEADDFAEIAGAIRGFFMTRGEMQAVETMMAEHRPKT
jgi:hypothetical protein